MNQNIEDEFYAWLKDYMSESDALGLAVILTTYTKKYYKNRFVFGMILGSLTTIILLKWLS